MLLPGAGVGCSLSVKLFWHVFSAVVSSLHPSTEVIQSCVVGRLACWKVGHGGCGLPFGVVTTSPWSMRGSYLGLVDF